MTIGLLNLLLFGQKPGWVDLDALHVDHLGAGPPGSDVHLSVGDGLVPVVVFVIVFVVFGRLVDDGTSQELEGFDDADDTDVVDG